jgi:hypothetical protein
MKVLVASVAVALLVGHLLRETPGYAVRNPDGSLQGDLEHYVYWTRLVTLGGIQAAYGGSWPETYAVYPPLSLYGFQLVGSVYQRLEDPEFDPGRAQASLWLRTAFKALAMGWHLLAGLAIYLLVRRAKGPTLGGLAGALYVVNPAALYDVAHWGQPDGAHSLFAVLSIGALAAARDVFGWGAMALAALAKPQAWSLLPLVLIATLRSRRSPSRLALDAAGGLLVGLVVISPFIVTGHLGDLLTLPGTMSSVMPVVSADAHNVWWLAFAPHSEDALTVFDSQRLVGPLSFRAVAGLLVLAQLGLTCWLYWTRRVSLAEAAALGALGWFVFTTQAHENHLFFALPLLALAWPERRSLLVVYAVLSVTLLLNMVLHDQLVLEALESGTGDRWVRILRVLNAGLNVACCLAWTAWASLRPAGAAVPSERAASMFPVAEGHALHA